MSSTPNEVRADRTMGPGTYIDSKYDVELVKREELDALSLEVYGAKSRWIKLTTKGRQETRTVEITELVPRADDSGESDPLKSRVPVFADKAEKSRIFDLKRYSLEEVETQMRNLKAQQDAVKALIAKMQADARAQKEATNAALRATASAV